MSQSLLPADRVVLSPGQRRLLTGVPLVLAIAALGASSLGWSADPRRSLFAYLTAWLFITSLGAGALAWLMLLHVTGAVWSVSLRRLLEHLTRPLPWIAIGFLPIALNLQSLYPWADPSRVAADAELARKAVWLNPQFFLVRSGGYLIAWVLLAWILGALSDRQDQSADPSLRAPMRAVSAFGLIVLGLTTSCAAFDWIMSLDPHWISTIFGVYFWAGSLAGSIAALILTVLCFRALGGLKFAVTVEHLHDLAKLLFGFIVFWAYIAFSQYFLIWYANLPEETGWYIARRSESWNALSWGLCTGHFFIPFLLLLHRAVRRDPFWLGFLAAWILVFHYLDLYWLVMPAFRAEGFEPSMLDAAVALSLTFFYGAAVAHASRKRALIPVGDSRLAESVAFHQT
jgi:hypothetical protein